MSTLKICANCGNTVDATVRFCPTCGSNSFREFDPEKTAVLTPEASSPNQDVPQKAPTQQTDFQTPVSANQAYQTPAQVYQTPAQVYQTPVQAYQTPPQPYQAPAQPYQAPVNQPYPPKKKKGTKVWLIVLIVVGVLALAGIGFAAEKIFQAEGYGDAEENTSYSSKDKKEDTSGKKKSTSTGKKVTYTKGEIKNGYYVNEWANIKFKMTDKWYDDLSAHSRYEVSQTADCGFASIDTTNANQFVVTFEDLSSYSQITAKDYLSAAGNRSSSSLSGRGFTCANSYEGTMRIAGQEYATLEQVWNYSNASLIVKVCVRIQDDKAIVVAVTTQDATLVNSFLNSIQAAN